MRNRMKTGQGCYFVPATFRGPIPWDFQIGSIQPRAGARTILTAYSEERREVEEAELVKLNPAALAFLDGVESPGFGTGSSVFPALPKKPKKYTRRL
jgi:hypothetical protein